MDWCWLANDNVVRMTVSPLGSSLFPLGRKHGGQQSNSRGVSSARTHGPCRLEPTTHKLRRPCADESSRTHCLQVAIEKATTFEGVPIRDAGVDPENSPLGTEEDPETGAVFEMTLAHPDVLAKRNLTQHLLAIIGNSAYSNEVGANQCVLETAPKGQTPAGAAAGRTSFAAALAAVAAAVLAAVAAPLLL